MGLEIEHKYLVKNENYKNLASKVAHIAQGYLSRDKERTVRVRILNESAFITIKSKNHGDTRHEFEYSIPLEDAKELLRICLPPIIEKNRHYVEYEGFTWEVDEFLGELKGITVAEIELPSSDTQYTLPEFIGENVTDNPMYYNSNLHLLKK